MRPVVAAIAATIIATTANATYLTPASSARVIHVFSLLVTVPVLLDYTTHIVHSECDDGAATFVEW